MNQGVNLLGGAVIFAVELQRMVNFYQGVMDLRPGVEEKTYRKLNSQGVELLIHLLPPHIASTIIIDSPPIPRDSAVTKLVYVVQNLAAARTRAAELGGCVYAVDKQWEFENTIVCDGWDPEGNVFQLRQPIG